jgi:hypothetical protein
MLCLREQAGEVTVVLPAVLQSLLPRLLLLYQDQITVTLLLILEERVYFSTVLT